MGVVKSPGYVDKSRFVRSFLVHFVFRYEIMN